jgi:hypothetical protein
MGLVCMTASGIYHTWKYRQMMREPEEGEGGEEKVKEQEEEESAEPDQEGLDRRNLRY